MQLPYVVGCDGLRCSKALYAPVLATGSGGVVRSNFEGESGKMLNSCGQLLILFRLLLTRVHHNERDISFGKHLIGAAAFV